ncbi:GNAT family N-acetyltransferase [Paraburkholderia megapolitana]|uniref:Protein N-acetyltransferase, RimJ/RimL family n=1 Tax=Paraburkholderia megapolitana TaxID=420953 RepID=A0A1I3R2T4_9BURK|nr:GNAT family N-acetyltransferase [Paraburkholderia megapolitana]SFJ40844.1 Protein N-acetyltransferase, RimJ/RimL family [Paraburkholderia megapolitana]
MRVQTLPKSRYPGVSLRQLERGDQAAWYAYLRIPEVIQHTSWNLSGEHDLAPMFDGIESTVATSIRRLAIVDDTDNRLIGTIGFHSISVINRVAEIAYDLAPSHWGKGIASAMCATVTEWSFAGLGLVRVQATALDTNVRSVRVLERSGFQYEGLLRSYRMVRGVPGNFRLYARLAGDSIK